MSGVAIILAGLPGRAHNLTLERLRAAFPVGYVIRGVAAPLSSARRANYAPTAVDAVLAAASDAVFGHSRRPVSFCRNPQRTCAAKAIAGKTCGRSGAQSCALEAPTRLILLFQQGDAEQRLLSRFHFAALQRQLPERLYNKPALTAEYCVEQVTLLANKASLVEGALRDRGNPLLLPPKNFGKGGAVSNLLNAVNACADIKQSVEGFRRDHFRRDVRKFEGSRNLGFKPAERNEQHGTGTEAPSIDWALPKRFRLGCAYDNSQHWDVSPLDGKGFQKKIAVTCREHGRQFPPKRHVNIWPDDWIGPK